MNKLYVVLDETLSTGQKMAQATHAAAEFMLKRPGEWNNEIIVILQTTQEVVEFFIEDWPEHCVGYQDEYYDKPKAVAIIDPPFELKGIMDRLKLAR